MSIERCFNTKGVDLRGFSKYWAKFGFLIRSLESFKWISLKTKPSKVPTFKISVLFDRYFFYEIWKSSKYVPIVPEDLYASAEKLKLTVIAFFQKMVSILRSSFRTAYNLEFEHNSLPFTHKKYNSCSPINVQIFGVYFNKYLWVI